MNFRKFNMILIIEFSFKVFGFQMKAQTISEHCVFQKFSRSSKSLKIEKMVSKLKKWLKIGELCLKLVKFVVFTQKIQKKNCLVNFEKFHLELANSHTNPGEHDVLPLQVQCPGPVPGGQPWVPRVSWAGQGGALPVPQVQGRLYTLLVCTLKLFPHILLVFIFPQLLYHFFLFFLIISFSSLPFPFFHCSLILTLPSFWY